MDTIDTVSYSQSMGLVLTSKRGQRVNIEPEHLHEWVQCCDVSMLRGTPWNKVTEACSEWTQRFA